MSTLRRLCLLMAVVCLTTFASAQTGEAGSCPVDTRERNIKVCSPAPDSRVPARFTYSFSAYSPSAPISAIRISSAGRVFDFQPNANQFARDITIEHIPRYENYGVLAQMWDVNGIYYETFIFVWVRKTAGTCVFPLAQGVVNMCDPTATGTVTSPVKIVANSYSPWFVSHIKVYVDGLERYFADDDEVYTYIPMTPGAHNVVIQSWDSQGNLARSERSITVVDRKTFCAPMNGDGVQLCQPQEGEVGNSPLRLSARSSGIAVPITYLRLYRDAQPIWEGEFKSVDTDVHFQQLGSPEGAATFGLVGWNAQGAAFVDTASATVKGYMAPPNCAIPEDQKVVLCYPSSGDVSPTAGLISARARWDGKRISAIRVYVDYVNKLTVGLGQRQDSIYERVTFAPGAHKLVVVAWTDAGDVMVSPETLITVY
jgi:hypothetical protein